MPAAPPAFFEAFGIELEYMIVDRRRFSPLPIAEKILQDDSGNVVNKIAIGDVLVSNELANHVLEFKTPAPTRDFAALGAALRAAIAEVNARLAPFDATLASGGMHPFMDPARESQLWPHGNRAVYQAYDRVFGCRSHGWLNLQSCHLNLPFATEYEFGILHAAVTIALPYLSALSASSPYYDGQHHGFLDSRLRFYAENQASVPETAGHIVPEPVFTRDAYERQILQPAYAAIAPHDPGNILQHEWLNTRGAIARFDRAAIEIRVLDTQENPSRDLAICALVISLLKQLSLIEPERLRDLVLRHSPAERRQQFIDVARYGRGASIDLDDIASALRLDKPPVDVGELWKSVLRSHERSAFVKPHLVILRDIVSQSSLAERLLARYGPKPTRESLQTALADLANSLAT